MAIWLRGLERWYLVLGGVAVVGRGFEPQSDLELSFAKILIWKYSVLFLTGLHGLLSGISQSHIVDTGPTRPDYATDFGPLPNPFNVDRPPMVHACTGFKNDMLIALMIIILFKSIYFN
jgi:hypothetical protein